MIPERGGTQSAYTRLTLHAYDLVVHGLSNHLLWKCPTAVLRAMYDEHLSSNHLDVGVGSGYFLDRCRFPSPSPRVALMDVNGHSLAHTGRRIARYSPERYRWDVLSPISLDVAPFDTISLTYLLHCIPAEMREKVAVFDHLRALLRPGGRLFGATLVQGGVTPSRAAQALMNGYNRAGVFHNAGDTVAELSRALEQRFAESRVVVHGCAAVFWARAPSA